MGELFGTDGVRGIANADLSLELAMRMGQAGAFALASEVHSPRILIGTDTRKSADMLFGALSAGICSIGGDVVYLGVVPTPALAYLVRLYEADAAVMISASHNLMEYNGFKWFDKRGYKLSDSLEAQIEALIRDGCPKPRPTGSLVGRVTRAKRAALDYTDFLLKAADCSLLGMRLVLDCANGAASDLAKEVFSKLGATVLSFSDEPDGYNINDQCGSTHPERLRQLVSETCADIGFAFDGDADRLIAVDERGRIVDGDRIIGILALDYKKRGLLKDDTLVITVMSNLGLKLKLNETGIKTEETAVGDRYVLERILEKGYSFGGEQSGHIIFANDHTTGDGMLSAIKLLNVITHSGRRFSELADEIPICPQVLVNVIVDEQAKDAALNDKDLKEAACGAEAALGKSGRVLIRKSGTEPLIRIMLEGMDETDLRARAGALAHILITNHNGRLKG